MNILEPSVILLSPTKENRTLIDIAARLTRLESLQTIREQPVNQKLIDKCLDSGHMSISEFDNYTFLLEGFSRVTECQLIRHRIGVSYCIKSGRVDIENREFNVCLPEHLRDDQEAIQILNQIESWYNRRKLEGYKDEDLRYLKPQATEFKAIVQFNTRSLAHFFELRLCENAQAEIRNMARLMYKLVYEVRPNIWKHFGKPCRKGFCPQGEFQNKKCNVPLSPELI